MTTARNPRRKRPPALRDVAELAGVSIKTVSNVVNDFPQVSPATRQRVREAIAEVGYRPQIAARQLRTGASGLITLAVPTLQVSYFSDLAQAFVEAAQGRGQTVLLHSTSAGREEEKRVLDGFERVLADGLIFSPLRIERAAVASMERTVQPTVFIGEHLSQTPLPEGSDYVRIDNEQATYEATMHLLHQGRRRLAFLGTHPDLAEGEQHGSAVQRTAGFRRALREADAEEDAAGVHDVLEWHRAAGPTAVEALLREVPAVDGIVCANDDLALGVLSSLRSHGRRIPEDVAVVGYDDTPDAPYTAPPLSSISPDKAFLAQRALDMLGERIGGYDGPPRTETVPHRLVERDSSRV